MNEEKSESKSNALADCDTIDDNHVKGNDRNADDDDDDDDDYNDNGDDDDDDQGDTGCWENDDDDKDDDDDDDDVKYMYAGMIKISRSQNNK